MKILFLTDNFPPEVNAPAIRTFEHVKVWQELGVEVTVVTCAPNFPKGKVFPGFKNKIYQRKLENGIDVIRVWSYISSNDGFTKRIIDYISFAITSTVASLKLDFDVIIATSPQFFTAVAGRSVSFLKRKPWIMEVRDLWPESIRAVGAAKGPSALLDWLEKLELHLYHNAKKVVVVTDSFKTNLISRGIVANKIEIVTNGVDLTIYGIKKKNKDLVENLKLSGKTIVGYLGTHGMAHGLDFILSCLQEVDDSIHFLFVGDGAKKEELVAQASELKLDNITFLPSVPKAVILDYLSIIDIALVPLKRSDTFKSVIPSKIFESAATATPILLGVEGESKGILEYYGAGLAFEPENREDFLKQLHKLAMKEDVYLKAQQACVRLAADYSRQSLATKMLEFIKS